MKTFLIYTLLMFLVGCSYPDLSVSKEGGYLMVRGDTPGHVDFVIPTIYIEDEEQLAEDKEGIAIRNERLNSLRCMHFIFDGIYNGYHIDVMLHPDLDNDIIGMARYHFKSTTYDFYIETAYNWRWYYYVKDFEKVQFKGETYHAKLDEKDVIKGEVNDFAEDSPFFFKDVDFDGKKEILFCASGYQRTYFMVYKIINQRHAELMVTKPFNNFVYAFRESLDDDSVGIYFDYRNKTITINEPMGALSYNHDVYLHNPKASSILNQMIHIEGIHTEEGAMFVSREFLKYDKIVKVEVSYPIDSNWKVVAKYDRRRKEIQLVSLDLVNAHDKKIYRPLYW